MSKKVKYRESFLRESRRLITSSISRQGIVEVPDFEGTAKKCQRICSLDKWLADLKDKNGHVENGRKPVELVLSQIGAFARSIRET